MTGYRVVTLLDPFFYLWLATLAYAPFKFGKFVDQQAKDKRLIGAQLGLWSIALPAAAGLMLLMLPHLINREFIFGLCWFLSQSAWITYFILLFSDSATAKKKTAPT